MSSNLTKYMKIFTKNIERLAPTWTSYRLAKEAEISQATLSQIYSGRSVPSLETIVKIAKCLGVTPADLIADNGSTTIPADLLRMLENRDPVVYETIKNLLNAISAAEKKK